MYDQLDLFCSGVQLYQTSNLSGADSIQMTVYRFNIETTRRWHEIQIRKSCTRSRTISYFTNVPRSSRNQWHPAYYSIDQRFVTVVLYNWTLEQGSGNSISRENSTPLKKQKSLERLHLTSVFFSGDKVKERLTLVGVFLEGTTLVCYERNFVARKNTLHLTPKE
jgi:hypothetical protein